MMKVSACAAALRPWPKLAQFGIAPVHNISRPDSSCTIACANRHTALRVWKFDKQRGKRRILQNSKSESDPPPPQVPCQLRGIRARGEKVLGHIDHENASVFAFRDKCQQISRSFRNLFSQAAAAWPSHTVSVQTAPSQNGGNFPGIFQIYARACSPFATFFALFNTSCVNRTCEFAITSRFGSHRAKRQTGTWPVNRSRRFHLYFFNPVCYLRKSPGNLRNGPC